MAKIKHTKNELKAQRDALRRFERYLPTLQLKKQQLQVEVRNAESQMRAKIKDIEVLETDLEAWVRLFGRPFPFEEHLRLEAVREELGNIAGVSIPILEEVVFARTSPDLHETDPWVDDGLRAVEQAVRLWMELHTLREQHRRLSEELRTTNQRVNLFEKVKIPETREHIRVIRVFLGDQQTAEVARAKIAKGKTQESEAAA